MLPEAQFSRAAGVWLALFILALVSPGAVAQTSVGTPRTIRVVTDNVYAPYSFQSDEGKLQGIVIDQWQAWEKKTGVTVEIHAMDWGEALRRMRAGEFDVIDCIVETAERRPYFDFTPTYAAIEVPIFFRNDISGITNIASLKGFPVGVKTGDQHIDRLKASGVTTLIPFQNYDAMIAAAKQHKINVFIADAPSALYLLNKMGIEADFRHSAPVFQDELRRAVRKGDAALLRTVSQGFAAIEPSELKQIDEKWFGRTINRMRRYLTYAGYAVAVALLLIAGLVGWNRTLKRKILQRTAALSESEQRFRRLVELMPVAVYVCDTSGIIQIYNHRAVELWGREPQSGDTAHRYCASLRLYTPDGKLVPHEESKMAEVLRTGVPAHDQEVVVERLDGSRITTQVNIAPLRNGDGELIGALNCFQDITERKQSQDLLRRSEEKFKTLFGIAPVGISVLDRQHNIVDANPALERITRLSKEELLNGAWQRRTYLNEDGTPKPVNDLPSKHAVTENRPLNDVETGIVTGNGEIIWTQVSVAPLALTDAIAVVITQDITERKRAEQALRESEERFRELAENIDDLVWLSDPQHKEVLYVSPAYERIWGRTRASLYASVRSWTEALHPEDRERILALRADDHFQEMPELTYRIVRPDGSIRWIYSREFPVKDADGKVIRVAGIVEDITERKRVELALDERLRFETLLTELSAAFANLPTTPVDQEIDKWLQNLVEFLDLDRATFDQIGEDGVTLSRSHSHTVRGIEPLSLIVTNDQLPWMTEQLLRGNTIKWSRIPDDMPEQASKEKEFAGRVGAKSVLIIPVCIGGSLICAISFTSMRSYRDWPDETVARLRLVGEIFANAIARKRAEEALFRREVELDQAQRLASLGSWEWDILADGLTYSHELRRIYGFKREDLSSPDKAFSDAIHPDDRVRRNAAIDAALNGGPPYNAEFRIIRPDKSVRFVHSRGRLIYDKAGKPVRMFGMAQDITERKRAAKELVEANRQLRFLSRRQGQVQEDERRRLARELHDQLGQALMASKVNVESALQSAPGDSTKQALVDTIALVDQMLQQVRDISFDLRPPVLDDLGLAPALRWTLDRYAQRAGLITEFFADPTLPRTDVEIETACFRIALEAITNVVRHAHAKKIRLELRQSDNALHLLVRDDGIGFNAATAEKGAARLGLAGMYERAFVVGGKCECRSTPGEGTKVHASFPISSSEASEE